VASKKVGIEMNAEKTKYIFLYREHNGGKICNIKIGNKSLESVVTFKHFDAALTNQNYMHEEMKCR
jgi:hypothetical protein